MKRLLLFLLLVPWVASSQVTNYFDFMVSSNITVNSSFTTGNALTVNSDFGPVISFQQFGAVSHNANGPEFLYYTDDSFVPAGQVYTGFWFTASALLMKGFVTEGTTHNLIHNGALTINGTGAALTNTGDYYAVKGASIVPGISITQHLTDYVLGTITNVFAHGILVASGVSHGSSLILPGGGYILQVNGGSLLLP